MPEYWYDIVLQHKHIQDVCNIVMFFFNSTIYYTGLGGRP